MYLVGVPPEHLSPTLFAVFCVLWTLMIVLGAACLWMAVRHPES